MAIEDVTDTLNAFNGFLTDLLGYQDLLNTIDKHREDVENSRASLNHQLGVMNAALNDLGAARHMNISGHTFPIFETAFGQFDDDSAFIVHRALTTAIDVTRQMIGQLQRLEATEVRRADAERRVAFEGTNTIPLPPDPPRRWPLFLGGFTFGWILAVYRWQTVNFFRYAFPGWNIVLKAVLIAVLALAVATIPNLIAEGGFAGMKKNFWTRLALAVAFVILFILAAYFSKFSTS